METINESHAAPDLATSLPQLPRPPSPSADRGIVPGTESSLTDSGTLPNADDIDLFTLSPVAALRMLCSTVETLVHITGDVPPTPPISPPSTPNLGLIQAEKESVARHTKEHRRRQSGGAENTGDVDGVPARAKTPIGSPEAGPSEPLHVIGSNMEPLNIQCVILSEAVLPHSCWLMSRPTCPKSSLLLRHISRLRKPPKRVMLTPKSSRHGAIIRKFYSKKPPPISLEEYLLRLHRYCPMSTAVYLATSLYIFKLAVVERIIPVTSRNVHRLVLAGLRVAMKALEDFSYPHRRFAKVGGVGETELGRLEVSFCFVTNFELRVDREGLLEHAKSIRHRESLYRPQEDLRPQLPTRDLVAEQSKPPTVTAETPAAA